MTIKGILFSLLIVSSLNLAYAAPATNNKPGSIERYSWVGGNKEGTVVAIMLSYFGPTSGSPYVKLIVKKAGEVEPIFTDGASMMGGGERELAELASYLLEKNTENLKTLDITLSNDFISDANIVIPRNENSTIISGWLDIENVGLKSFTVQSEKGDVCSFDENMSSYGLTFRFDNAKKITVPPNANSCWSENFIVRNVFRTQKALWFIVYQHTYGLGSVDTWWIDVEGIKF